MEKECNIFIVHTEYHVLLTINIICNHFFGCNNRVYWTPSIRMNKLLLPAMEGISAHQLPNDYGNRIVLDEILSYKPKRFFFFQDGDVNNMFLCNRLAKNGTKTALVQDGLKPYLIWQKRHKWLIAFINTIKAHWCLFQRQVFTPSLGWMDIYDYGSRHYIEELWLTNPDAFVNKHHKILIQIPLINKQALSICNSTFGYDEKEELNSVVLIIGQPTIDSQNWEFDTLIVERIIKKFSDHIVLYKPHPSTNPEHLNMIKGLMYDNFHFYNKKIPVELLILQLKDSVIIARRSTSMLTENKSCKYYWTYKLYPLDIQSSQFERINPTKHVKDINTIDEIVF